MKAIYKFRSNSKFLSRVIYSYKTFKTTSAVRKIEKSSSYNCMLKLSNTYGYDFQQISPGNRHNYHFRMFTTSNCLKSEWTPNNLPNPFISPEKAGRPGVDKSNVCDPCNILSKESKDVIEGYLNDYKGHGVVLIIDKMSNHFIKAHSHDIDVATKSYAMTVHDLWGIGDKNRNDGILIFLSTDDRAIFVSTGVGVSNILTEQAIQTVVENMKPYLRQRNYGDALEFAVLEIDFLLKRSKSHSNNSNKNDRKNDENMYSKYLPWLSFFVIFSLLVSNSSDSKTKKLKASKEALDRIYDHDEISCPNCFRLYQTDENLSVDDEKRRVLLTCGHSFCNACYRKDLVQSDGKESRCCLLCGEPCTEAAAPSDSELPTGENKQPLCDKLPEKKSSRYYDYNIVQYRINKYYYMYEDVVSKEDVETMKKEATKGPHEGKLAVLRQKKATENKLIELKRQKRDEAMKSGSLGSSRDERESGSGGTSSGGAGGRW